MPPLTDTFLLGVAAVLFAVEAWRSKSLVALGLCLLALALAFSP